jgi:hypothetical protein
MRAFFTVTGAVLLVAVGFFFWELKRPASHLEVASSTQMAAPPQGALRVAEAPRPMPKPPEMAKLKPVPYVLPKEMRDPAHLPLQHPVMAGPPQTPPPDPFTLPKAELVARGGTVP